MKVKKIILGIIALLIVLGIVFLILLGGKTERSENGKIKLVASNFASYDFLRAIVGNIENIDVSLLIGPGKETHSYEPTAGDIIKIQNADLFVYVGGEMEQWANKIVAAMPDKINNTLCISDFVDMDYEKDVDGAEEETEEEHEKGAFDEHIWTSPKNAIKMINVLEEKVENIDSENKMIYKQNAENYISQINEVDSKIQKIVDSRIRDRLVFADKMPMQYFIDYYNLKVSAAFNGCSTETEPSAKTIAYLQNVIKQENIPVVLYIELNPGTVARTIANETGCDIAQIQTLHNVSLEDFNKGETWVSLMTRNIDVLNKALK